MGAGDWMISAEEMLEWYISFDLIQWEGQSVEKPVATNQVRRRQTYMLNRSNPEIIGNNHRPGSAMRLWIHSSFCYYCSCFSLTLLEEAMVYSKLEPCMAVLQGKR